MEKIYVVTGTTGQYEDTNTTIRYAGIDKEKAFGYILNDGFETHTLFIEIWVNGKQIKGFYKDANSNEEWKVNFDKIEELKRVIDYKKKQFEESEQELYDIELENFE